MISALSNFVKALTELVPKGSGAMEKAQIVKGQAEVRKQLSLVAVNLAIELSYVKEVEKDNRAVCSPGSVLTHSCSCHVHLGQN